MPIRSLGSTLIAKASPGSATRKTQEQNIVQPEIPGKASIGSVDRVAVQDPLERSVPTGSEKIISVRPTVEPNAVDASSVNPVLAPIAPGVGLPSTISQTTPPGAQNQSLLRGGLGTARPVAPVAPLPPPPPESQLSAPSAPSNNPSPSPSPQPSAPPLRTQPSTPLRTQSVLGAQTQQKTQAPGARVLRSAPSATVGNRSIVQLPDFGNLIRDILQRLRNPSGLA